MKPTFGCPVHNVRLLQNTAHFGGHEPVILDFFQGAPLPTESKQNPQMVDSPLGTQTSPETSGRINSHHSIVMTQGEVMINEPELSYNVRPPGYVCWLTKAPVTIVISTINHSYWSYLHQLSYLGGLTL